MCKKEDCGFQHEGDCGECDLVCIKCGHHGMRLSKIEGVEVDKVTCPNCGHGPYITSATQPRDRV